MIRFSSFWPFQSSKEPRQKQIQKKMEGVWELVSFSFDNKPWNSDPNPKGKIIFHEDTDLVSVAINTSTIASSKSDEEFLSQLIFYLAEWQVETNQANEDISKHKVFKASGPSRINVLEHRKIEFTPDGFLRLSGNQPGSNKPIELIWKRKEVKKEQEKEQEQNEKQTEVEPTTRVFYVDMMSDYTVQLENNPYGVVFITSDGEIFFNACMPQMEGLKSKQHSEIMQNIFFFHGQCEKNEGKKDSKKEDEENSKEEILNYTIDLFSNPRFQSQKIEVHLSKKDPGYLSFRLLDNEYYFSTTTIRSHTSQEQKSREHEHLSPPKI